MNKVDDRACLSRSYTVYGSDANPVSDRSKIRLHPVKASVRNNQLLSLSSFILFLRNMSSSTEEQQGSNITQSPSLKSQLEGSQLSKNAQKKLAKAARFAEQKKERRAAEKERKKEKRRLQAQKRAAEDLDGENEGQDDAADGRKRRKVEEQRGPRVPFGARVVVDLGFDDMMSENVRKLCRL